MSSSTCGASMHLEKIGLFFCFCFCVPVEEDMDPMVDRVVILDLLLLLRLFGLLVIPSNFGYTFFRMASKLNWK